jgi:5-methyltetrahydropteroyltriglutamate--homocysteine methyltransferase
MKDVFPTQDIGSLAKPPWLLKAYRSNVKTKELEDAKNWGNILGIENAEKLLAILQGENPKEHKTELRDWAALYGLRFCESSGLDFVYDGEVRRVEMYEYPIRRTDGFEFKGLVRSFDNKYYRKAACTDKVKFKTAYHLDEFKFVNSHTERKTKVPITGPYTLADWSFNEYYQKKAGTGVSREKKKEARRLLVLDIAKNVIRPNVKALVDEGADYIQIDEPAATTQPDEIKFFVDSFNEATEGIDCKFSVHICFSNYRLLYPHVLEMKKCSQFSWEFSNRDDDNRSGYKDLALLKEYGDKKEIGLGVLDVHTNFIESPELVRDRILYAAKVLDDPGKIYVNPDCGLRTRTWAVAFEKIKNMVEGTLLARKEFA